MTTDSKAIIHNYWKAKLIKLYEEQKQISLWDFAKRKEIKSWIKYYEFLVLDEEIS